jgi:uncharacterized protein
MSSHKQDLQYMNIVQNILNNDEFLKIKNIEHHGTSRYDHSLKVSYYSYKVAKALKLDYEQTAVGGLLHDFFLSPENRTNKERFLSTFTHPKKAVEKARENFSLTKKEEDMIRTHMFPINLAIPKYMESWIISTVDKCVAVNEFSVKFKFKIRYAYDLMLLFFITFVKY